MENWTPTIGDSVYLLQPNRQFNKQIGDLYGLFNGIFDSKYQIIRYDDKVFNYEKATFFKFYSGEPIVVKNKTCKVNLDVGKSAKIKRKP